MNRFLYNVDIVGCRHCPILFFLPWTCYFLYMPIGKRYNILRLKYVAISPYSIKKGFALGTHRECNQHKKHKRYMANAKIGSMGLRVGSVGIAVVSARLFSVGIGNAKLSRWGPFPT